MQALKRNPLPHSPLLWLMLLAALWACLGAQTLSLKTASGQIYGLKSASWESTPLQAAPRLGLRASELESVSAPPVGGKEVSVGRWSKTPTGLDQFAASGRAWVVIQAHVGLFECRPTGMSWREGQVPSCRSVVEDPDRVCLAQRFMVSRSCRTLRVPTYGDVLARRENAFL